MRERQALGGPAQHQQRGLEARQSQAQSRAPRRDGLHELLAPPSHGLDGRQTRLRDREAPNGRTALDNGRMCADTESRTRTAVHMFRLEQPRAASEQSTPVSDGQKTRATSRVRISRDKYIVPV